jgi:hypothetical protein
MVNDKECDIVVLQGYERLLPLEVKHHYHWDLWVAWKSQLEKLYSSDANAGGFGIYLVFWSGEITDGCKMPKIPHGLERPKSANELKNALVSLIPKDDRFHLQVVVIDISVPV